MTQSVTANASDKKFIPLTSFNLGTFIVTKITYFYFIGAFNSPAERHLKVLTFSVCGWFFII